MASVYFKDFEVFVAERFKQSISTSNVYLTFGKPTPWTNDLSPDQANTSVSSYNEVWKNMVGGKKITGSDVRHVIPRFNWTTNTIYTAYDNSIDSLVLKNANTKFYVVTDDFNVYKCISNNNGQVSTYKPTSTNPASQFQTADKYIWKYMYTLTGEEQMRFTTDRFIPVKTLKADDNTLQWQVQQDAIPGALNEIVVTNPGSGYLTNSISVVVTGDGQFANAFATRNVITHVIDSITIDNKGSGYTYANISLISSTGNNATFKSVISPPGGHGADPLFELGGSYLMINTKLDGSEKGTIITRNDYRQIAILQDPLVYATSNVSTNLAFSQVTTISLSQGGGSANYTIDETVYQGTSISNSYFRGTVAYWDSANSLIKLTNVVGAPTSQLLIGNTSTTSKYVSSVTDPGLKPYSGYLLYMDNITPITRADDQSEDFKIVLSF